MIVQNPQVASMEQSVTQTWYGYCGLQMLLTTILVLLPAIQVGAQPQTDAPSTQPAEVTFTRNIAPIIFHSCSSCHHPGEAAPFSLLTYDDVHRRARQIVDVTQKRFMPPWLPTQGHDVFRDARKLSDADLKMIDQWVNSGSPKGDDADLPAAPTFSENWQAGTPDLVLETPAYQLASEERDVFRNFVVPIELDSPRWIESIELQPENPRVTHHARLGVDSSNESLRRDAEDAAPGYAGMAWGQDPDGQLVIWAPGMVAHPGTPGVAWRLHPKSCLVLHTHMQPSGKPEVVKFRIGIRFAKTPPQQRPVMMRIGSTNIDIPAGESRHVVTDQYTLPVDVDIETIFPHAHSLCHDLSVTAESPDGSEQTLISIEHFDENWHDSYRFAKPLRLSRGTRVITTFAYDNTEGNVRNRNHPPKRVVYGSNATDEMADVYLQVSAVHPDQREVLLENYKRYETRSQIIGYRKSLELYPDNPWSMEGLATSYVGSGKPEMAITVLEQRLKTGETAVYPIVSLGMALLAKGDLVQAEAKLRQAISMDEKYPLAWFGLGKCLANQKKSEPAEQAYRRAAELAPGLSEARLNLADLLMQRGALDEAAAVCTTALNDSPDTPNLYLKLGEISAKRKNYDESLKFFEQARKLAPYTHPPKVLLAAYFCANGDVPQGIKLLREANTESPNYPIPSLFLGQLEARQKNLKQAREYLDAADAMPIPDNWPESHQQRFGVLLQSERFRLAQGLQDINLANDAVEKWLKYDPENPQLQKMNQELRNQLHQK